MTIVVDSSVAVKWFVEEPLREEAAGLLDNDEVLIAPDILMAEVTNALWRKVRIGQTSSDQVYRAISELETLVTLRPLTADLTRRAFHFSQEFNHSIYDCLFLACAVREQIQLVTADAKFVAKLAVSADLASVRLLQT